MPNSNVALGICPLEALVNLVAENLLFSELMASRANGSETPHKLVVFGTPQESGQYNDAVEVPLETDEQVRMEKIMNSQQKNKAVKIITGYGTPAILDLSKADTIGTQLERQNKVDHTIFGGFAFGWIAYRTKSFVWPFLIHWFIATFIIIVAAGLI